jgi:hypothetical protein
MEVGVRRSLSLVVGIIFILTGCGGGGGSSTSGSLVPGGGSGAGSSSSSGGGNVSFTLSIPMAASSSSVRRGIRTISSSTTSITVVVNGGAPQIFNVSSNCSGTPLTCRLSVGAPYGLDNFLIETWSGANGTGTALNAATLSMNVKTSGNPSPTVVAGTLATVTSNADSGGTCGLSTNSTAGCTLREAVSEASSISGATTAIMFQGVSSITLAGPISFQKNIVFIGPSSGSLTINGGGNQIFNASGNVVLSNMTLTGGNAASCADTAESFSGGCGGAIELNSGTLTLFSTTFNNDSATQVGGAIYTGAGTTLSIFNGTFTGNKVNASANFDSGGAIYLLGDASIDSSTFTNNSAVGPSGGEGDGGAITQSEFNSSGLTITNSQFLGNSAGGSSATTAFGGAIYAGAGGPVTISNDTFGSSSNGNTSNAGGTGGLAVAGAIYFFGTTLSDGGGANGFVGNKASAPDTSIGGFAAGGAIASQTGTITLSAANTFTGNSAAGGAAARGGAIDLETFQGLAVPVLTLTPNNTFTSNSVQTTAAQDAGAFGGAISLVNVNCTGSLTQTAASISRQKGQVFGPSAVMKAKIAAAYSRRQPRSSRQVKAASITTSGVSTLEGTFTSNNAGPSAYWGAGGGAISISSDSTGTFTIQNATFTNNSTSAPTTGQTGSGGGAVGVFAGTAIIINSQVGPGNSATTGGGGLYATSAPSSLLGPGCPALGGTLTIANTTISGNSVTGGGSESFFGGGGIGVAFGGLAIDESTIANNSVAGGTGGNGGGVMAINDAATGFETIAVLENSTIFNNTSSGNGGGMAAVGDGQTLVSLTNDTIYKNTATGGKGGNGFSEPTIFQTSPPPGTIVVQFQNTIIAGGSASVADTNDVWNNDTIQSLDYNIVQTPSSTSPGSGSCANGSTVGGGYCAHDQAHVDPQLASGLASNGGATQTIADTSSSPGRGIVPFTNGLCNNAPFTNVDQRGYARGAGGVCDVGAYEFTGTPTNATPAPVPTANVGVTISSGARRP